MTVKEKLVATLPPLGFIVDGHTEEFDFCCEDVNGYDCLLTLELHPNFLYAVAFVFPSPQSPDSVEFDIEFPLTVTSEEIYRWVFDCSKRLDEPGCATRLGASDNLSETFSGPAWQHRRRRVAPRLRRSMARAFRAFV